MRKQTIVWTALPAGTDGPVVEGSTLRLSVLASPRLWNDDPSVTKMQLSEFPDFLDWPAVIAGTTFEVQFDGGATVAATADTTPLGSGYWQALFKTTTDVIPFAFEDFSGAEILSFPSDTIHEHLVSTYTTVAIDDDYGAGADLPDGDRLAQNPDLVDIARPVTKEPPYEPVDPDRGPIVVADPHQPETPGPGDKGGCMGCLFAIFMLPVRIFRAIVRLLRSLGIISILPALVLLGALPRSIRLSPGGGTAGTGTAGTGGPAQPSASAKQQAFNQLGQYMAPTSATSQPLPSPADLEDTYDFHKMVAALGDYPKLLRRMGLVVDLTVTVPAGGLPATGTVRVVPTLPATVAATANHSPRTHYDLDEDVFLARPRTPGADVANGLLRLQDTTRFQVQQVDVVGGGLKLQNAATNIVGLRTLDEVPANSPKGEGLPALQTAGLALVRPKVVDFLRERFRWSYAFNRGLASLDASPVKPFAGGGPDPGATDELFAEDLVRGYRLDVRDDKANRWLSLHRRVGTYEFLDSADPPLVEEDEGFVQMSATESLAPAATRVLRAHEALFAWEGWSLGAPRPGQAILADGTGDDIENPAVTPFKLEVTYKAKPASLPRLRFGSRYRLRARVVDLAGNSVFEPETAAFDSTPAEATPEVMFRRYEPVPPPPVALRTEPKEGESLETVTVRSAVPDPAATVEAQTTERHLAPPKAAQLLVERHGRFDNGPTMAGDAAGYDLASREAGSLTQFFDTATATMKPVAGVVHKPDGAADPTYFLQTNESFDVAYLPDPYARGVLLLGVPGLPPLDIVDGVNRIAFQGAWPDLEPMRLRVQGIVAGSAPAAPSWDAVARLLTVQLPQGETARVRVCSWFEAADLETMGVWGWVEDAAPPDLANLRTTTIRGRSWLHLPFRELVLIHAVQQPLAIPTLSPLNVDPPRTLGSTSASLSGEVLVDAKSTGKVDVAASWTDPVDDPKAPAPSTEGHEMPVGELTISDPGDDSQTIASILTAMGDKDPVPALQHAIGDTKYHHVTYTPTATTRFREHFPAAIAGDPTKLVRPMAGDPGPNVTQVHVPNTARPDAPRPIVVLPTFRWTQTEAGGTRTRVREGGLRVYLERPWYSSGDRELLGVVLRQSGVPPFDPGTDALRKYVSEWGMDPLWDAAPFAPLAMADFAAPAETHVGAVLAELPQPLVDVAGFPVTFDPQSPPSPGRWVADIELSLDERYFPFVRLALARFQPISILGAHISPVVLSDFVQVVPKRTAEYDFNGLPTGKLPVRVIGPSPRVSDSPRRTTMMIARLEEREHGDALIDPVGWRPIASVLLDAVPLSDFVTAWNGVLDLPAAPPTPLRVSILEAQVLDADKGGLDAVGRAPLTAAIADLQGAEAGADEPGLGFRIVYADATVLP